MCRPTLQGQTVNAQYYRSFLQCHLRPAVRSVQNWLKISSDMLTLQCTHETLKSVLRRCGWEVLRHPPYCPDLSPCDYDLILKLKHAWRGKRFADRNFAAVRHEVAHISTSCATDVVASLPIVGNKPWTTTEITLKVINSLYE
jgi:transposase